MPPEAHPDTSVTPDRWQLSGDGIEWLVSQDSRLPHRDHLEMSGRRISVIVRLEVNRRRELILPRTIIWPTLRGWPDDFRGYLKQTFASDFEPPVLLDGKEVHPGHAPLRRMHFDGILTVEHASLRGVRAFGHAFDLEIQRESARHLRLTVQHQDGPTRTDVAPEGQAVQVAFG